MKVIRASLARITSQTFVKEENVSNESCTKTENTFCDKHTLSSVVRVSL
jgi:hypothetical protein